MNQILHCDWLSYKKKFPESHIINPLLTQLVQMLKMAVYWPRSLFGVFMDLNSVSVQKHKKRTWPIYSHRDPTLGQ